MLKNSEVVLFVTLKSWSARKLLDPTTYLTKQLHMYAYMLDLRFSLRCSLEYSVIRRNVYWETVTFRNNLLPPYIESTQSKKSEFLRLFFKLAFSSETSVNIHIPEDSNLQMYCIYLYDSWSGQKLLDPTTYLLLSSYMLWPYLAIIRELIPKYCFKHTAVKWVTMNVRVLMYIVHNLQIFG